jgi:hypothetical protein
MLLLWGNVRSHNCHERVVEVKPGGGGIRPRFGANGVGGDRDTVKLGH